MKKCTATHLTCGTRATNSNLKQFHQLPPDVRRLSASDLHIIPHCVGKGAYGKCYFANIAQIQVCAKVFRSDDTFNNEVYMLSQCCHENIPWIYGIAFTDSKIIIMSRHSVNGSACSLHKYVCSRHNPDNVPELSALQSKTILSGVASAISYIHSKEILHNDIKCDNVILQSVSTGLKGILIDFGKACLVSSAKQYNLSNEEKLKYIRNHPQIAPDLRDGKCKQSTQSDIYSFGRILKIVNDVSLNLPAITSLSGMCTEYAGSKRPTSNELFKSLTFLFSSD